MEYSGTRTRFQKFGCKVQLCRSYLRGLVNMFMTERFGRQGCLCWRGINGLVITPQFGPRVRLAAVFTEIENLPVYAGNEHAWVLDFCESCKRCIRDCPPEAFYEEPTQHENGLVTVLDNAKCFPYFVAYHGCSVCIKVCPFNQQSYDKIKDSFHFSNLERSKVEEKAQNVH